MTDQKNQTPPAPVDAVQGDLDQAKAILESETALVQRAAKRRALRGVALHP